MYGPIYSLPPPPTPPPAHRYTQTLPPTTPTLPHTTPHPPPTCHPHPCADIYPGLAGGSASGKTTVAQRIIESLGVRWVSLLSMDSFYKVLNEEQHKQAALNEYNFDHPGGGVEGGGVEGGGAKGGKE